MKKNNSFVYSSVLITFTLILVFTINTNLVANADEAETDIIETNITTSVDEEETDLDLISTTITDEIKGVESETNLPSEILFENYAFDIADYQWQLSVNQLYEDHILNGYPDGSFKPNNQINRAEFLKIIMEYSYSNIRSDYYAFPCFKDITGQEWYAKYACLAKEEGIILGYSDGEFKGDQPITQTEALKIIFTALEEEFFSTKGEWYEVYLNHSESIGMYYFNVKEPVDYLLTRGEMAYFVAWLSHYDSDQIIDYDFYKERYQNNIIYYTDDAEDCFETESYNEIKGFCYLECADDELCADKIEKIIEEISAYDEYIDSYEAPTEDYNSEDFGLIFSEYNIHKNVISLIDDIEIEDEAALEWQDNKDVHAEIWNYFVTLIPSQYRQNLTLFGVFTDGEGEVMAWVEPDTDNPYKWKLYIDPEDAYVNGQVNTKEITLTLIHEFAHLLSLDSSQVPPSDIDAELYSDKYFEIYLEEAEKCAPNYYPGEGCSNSDSYINQFYSKFWTDIYKELESIEQIEDELEYNESLYHFYLSHDGEFITEYAATNPAEDFAESFTFFVVKPRLVGNSIADEKIRFFYNYPELIELRAEIRKQL